MGSNKPVPPQVALDVEHYPVAPPELVLEQVHVYIRHGERAPVGVRMSAPPASIPEHWMMCKTARLFRAAVVGGEIPSTLIEGQTLPVKRVVEHVDGTSAEGECMLGELTDIGRQSTYNHGLALRKLYIDRLGFLPDRLLQESEIYLRSTNMPRTIESLQSIVHGLYPSSKIAPEVVHQILIRNGKDENLMGNMFSCKRLELLQLGFAQAAAATYNHTLEPLDKKISKYLGGNPIRIDGKPRASGILDTVRAALAHGVKVPPEFEDKAVIDVIEKAVVTEWFAGYKTEEVRRLGMGRMLNDLSRKMKYKADRGPADPLKILVHSTHDTALAALCSTLDVYDEKWPAFTASITFELFRNDSKSRGSYLQNVMGMISPFQSKTPATEHYVRMRYQNRNMMLPICADDGKHLPGSPEFCTLAAFRERLQELTPDNYELECDPAGR